MTYESHKGMFSTLNFPFCLRTRVKISLFVTTLKIFLLDQRDLKHIFCTHFGIFHFIKILQKLLFWSFWVGSRFPIFIDVLDFLKVDNWLEWLVVDNCQYSQIDFLTKIHSFAYYMVCILYGPFKLRWKPYFFVVFEFFLRRSIYRSSQM